MTVDEATAILVALALDLPMPMVGFESRKRAEQVAEALSTVKGAKFVVHDYQTHASAMPSYFITAGKATT